MNKNYVLKLFISIGCFTPVLALKDIMLSSVQGLTLGYSAMAFRIVANYFSQMVVRLISQLEKLFPLEHPLVFEHHICFSISYANFSLNQYLVFRVLLKINYHYVKLSLLV